MSSRMRTRETLTCFRISREEMYSSASVSSGESAFGLVGGIVRGEEMLDFSMAIVTRVGIALQQLSKQKIQRM